MIVKYIIAIVLIILAALLNFMPKPVLKLLKAKEDTNAILKVKLLAAGVCIFDFLLVLAWF